MTSTLYYRHKTLSTSLSRWSSHPSLHLRILPHVWWTAALLLPGIFLLLGMLFFARVHHLFGFVLALFSVGGFFWSLSSHRLSHDCRWPSPALIGALLAGILHTAVCYIIAIFPNILPFGSFCMYVYIVTGSCSIGMMSFNITFLVMHL